MVFIWQLCPCSSISGNCVTLFSELLLFRTMWVAPAGLFEGGLPSTQLESPELLFWATSASMPSLVHSDLYVGFVHNVIMFKP